MTNHPRILLVDDDLESAEPLGLLLEIEGYRVVKAADGLEALRCLLTEEDIALILLDCHMPDMDGATLLSEIREDSRLCELPVVIVSAYPPDGIRDRVQAVFTKPVDVRSLLRVLKNLLIHCSAIIPPESSILPSRKAAL